jgi:vacuolar-type H+-ATPase subunit E/Vma4
MNEENLSPTDFAPPETSSGTSRPSQGGGHQTPKSAQVTQAAQIEIEKLKGAAREEGSAAVEEIKAVAQSAAREAQEAGRDFAHEQKENLAQKVDKYAASVRAACDRLRSEEGNVLADPAQMAAEQLGKMSSYLREKELGDLVDDLESFT